jgi:hypothetical protein
MLEVAKSSVEAKLAVFPGSLELGEELAPQEPAQYALGQKKPVAAAHPSLLIRAQTSTWNHTMKMGVVM